MKFRLNNFQLLIRECFVLFGLTLVWISDTWGQTFDQGQGYLLSSQVNRGPESLAFGDLDRDGNLDLISADNGFLTLFFGDGTGGFPAKTTLSTRPSNATGTVANDDNEHVFLLETTGDGYLDIIASNILTNFTALTFFRSNSNSPGSYLLPSTRIRDGIGEAPAAAVALQANPAADSFIDFVLARKESPRIRTYLGDGQGGFSLGSVANLSSSPTSAGEGIASGDMNHDSLEDVVVVDRLRVWVLLNDGLGGWIRSASASSSQISGDHFEYDVALGDFNGDTHLDTAVANGGVFDTLTSTAHSVAVFFGDGLGGLTQNPVSIDLGSEVTDVETGDFDNDGHLDILAAVPDFATTLGGAKLIRGNGDGTFDTLNPISLPALGVATLCVATADIDKDGRLDVAIGNEGRFSGPGSAVPGTVSIYLSTLPDIGTATPTPTTTSSPTPTPTRTPIVPKNQDIDGDGAIDSRDLIILLEQLGNQTQNP